MSKRSGLADSPFFQTPAAEETPTGPTVGPVPGVPLVRGVLDVRDVRDEPPGRPVPHTKRALKRHPFDIYVDQLESLKVLKTQAMRRGEEASMSRMVREALDRYINRKA
jgi:hypothetical protein